MDNYKVVAAMQKRCLKCEYYKVENFGGDFEVHGCNKRDGIHTFIGSWIIAKKHEMIPRANEMNRDLTTSLLALNNCTFQLEILMEADNA